MPSLTLTVSDDTLARLKFRLGRAWNLVDAQQQPRDATNAELKQFIIGPAKQLLVDTEWAELRKAAADAVPQPTVDIT